MYTLKLREKSESDNSKFKVELMKLQMLGQMITGEDLRLIEKFEEQTEGKSKNVNEHLLKRAGLDII